MLVVPPPPSAGGEVPGVVLCHALVVDPASASAVRHLGAFKLPEVADFQGRRACLNCV